MNWQDLARVEARCQARPAGDEAACQADLERNRLEAQQRAHRRDVERLVLGETADLGGPDGGEQGQATATGLRRRSAARGESR